MIESVMGKGNRGIVEANFNGEVTFWYGSNEHYPKKTAELLKRHLPQMQVEVFEGMGHEQAIFSSIPKSAQYISYPKYHRMKKSFLSFLVLFRFYLFWLSAL